MTGIPSAALDGRICIVGITGSGKSTTAKGGVERLLADGRRVCVVDLLDAWWGLRLARDGRTPAYPVAIFGGQHGDLPLTEHAGALIGQAVAQSDGSCIVSLSELDGDAARRRFALAFFDALHKTNRAPLHLVIDECDFYSPQVPVKEGPGPLLLNRIKEIAARGRMRGFRVWPITQRPAKLHKDVLSQADTLVAMQLTSSQDRAALRAWIGDQGDENVGARMLQQLPSLKRGQGVLWSPRIGILDTVNFPLPATYDSSRTPEHGEKATSVELKPIDLGALREKMGKVEAEAKANDPRELRAEIARLRAELARKPAAAVDDAAIYAARQEGYREGFAAMAHHERDALERLREAGRKIGEAYAAFARGVEEGIAQAIKAAANIQPPPTKAPGVVHRQTPFVAQPAASAAPPRQPVAPSAGLTGPEQRILDALAWWGAIGVDRPSKIQVAIAANYSPNGGAFNNPLGRLRSGGLIDYPANGFVTLTAEGSAKANTPGTPPTTGELHTRVLGLLNGPQQKILGPLLAAYPGALDRAELAAAAGYSPDGGAFNNPLGSLRTLGLIDYPARGQVVALPILFVG